MTLPILAILLGFILLVWSADRFVEGAAVTAKYAGMPSLLIGMVIVGFGTSAPEMVVSAMAALDGNPNLAIGNALGSNIVNTGLILGVTALIAPIMVHSNIVRRQLPLLLGIGLIVGIMLLDGSLNTIDAWFLLIGFFTLIGWTIFKAVKDNNISSDSHSVASDVQHTFGHTMTLNRALFWLVAGLGILILSSRLLVWGAVSIAQQLGVSDLIIGLTIVAIGTSLPELAASVIAVRKGEHDIAIGNVVGSNIFNLLAVLGIAGVIAPVTNLDPGIMARDWPVMMALTFGLSVMVYGFKSMQGQLSRVKGVLLLLAYVAYNVWLVMSVMK